MNQAGSKSVPEYYGSKVFDERVMREMLSEEVFSLLMQTVRRGTTLDPSVADIDRTVMDLQKAVEDLDRIAGSTEKSIFVRDCLLARMDAVRRPCDEAETITAQSFWPIPTYGDLLFGV